VAESNEKPRARNTGKSMLFRAGAKETRRLLPYVCIPVVLVAVSCATNVLPWEPPEAPPPAPERRAVSFFLKRVETYLSRKTEDIDLLEALSALQEDIATDLPGYRCDVPGAREAVEESVGRCKAYLAAVSGDDAGIRAAEGIVRFVFNELRIAPRLRPSAENHGSDEAVFPGEVLARKRGDCLALGVLHLVLAREINVKLHGVLVGTHFFVRYEDGKTRRNFELLRRGHSHSDPYYRRRFRVPDGSSLQMRNLTGREVLCVVLFNVADAYCEARQHAKALRIYERVLEVLPGFAEARCDLALLDSKAGNHRRAIAGLNCALRCNPNLMGAYVNLAAEHIKLGEHAESIAVCKAGLAVRGDDACLLHAIGVAYHSQQQHKEAIRFYRLALASDPAHVLCRSNFKRARQALRSDCRGAEDSGPP